MIRNKMSINKKVTLLNEDKVRYGAGKCPLVQVLFRKTQKVKGMPSYFLYKFLYILIKKKYMVELAEETDIGGGLYLGHPFCITINPAVKIGRNVNIHKGVTIGQENRGKRKGYPVIGDSVWIGVNAVIVGKIVIGDDVLIAPNTFVNCDVPSHSVVFGNPCIIKRKEDATEGYIENKV